MGREPLRRFAMTRQRGILHRTFNFPPHPPPKRTSYGVATHPNWGPAKAQRSGFGGERRSKEVNGAFRPKGGNGVHGLCDDAGAFGAVRCRTCGGRLKVRCGNPSGSA